MKYIISIFIAFIFGVLLMAGITVKIVTQVVYDSGSANLGEKLEFSRIIDETKNEKLISEYNQALCQRLNWVEVLGKDFLNSESEITQQRIKHASTRCADYKEKFPGESIASLK